jgi:protein disulfide-isomerase
MRCVCLRFIFAVVSCLALAGCAAHPVEKLPPVKVRPPVAGWQTDLAIASEAARESGKYILIDFSGSDWCGWCMKLDKEAFSQAEFKDFAKDNLVCVLADFPRAKPQTNELKQQNAQLLKKYGIQGFPTIIILSPSGQMVAQTGYKPGGAAKYVEHLKQLIAEYKEKQKRT